MSRILSHVGPAPEVAECLAGRGVRVPEIVPIDPTGPLPDTAHGEILLTLMNGTPNLGDVLERGVKWVHTVGTGVDDFPVHLLGDRPLTISRGATSVSIAEWVMAQILAAEKDLPDSWISEPPEVWGGTELGGLEGATVAILGFGATGTALASRALAFDCRVRALRRSNAPSPVPGVEIVTDVASLLRDADHVVLAASLTEETRDMVNAEFLNAMRKGAHLVNVARAGLVVEEDLRAALDSGQLGRASIDVAPVEPLPAGHWLYLHPRVHFSPHVSWNGRGVLRAVMQTFADNYVRWAEGRALANLVDPTLGY